MGCLHPPGRSAGKGDAPTVGRAVLTPHPDPGSTPREAALDTRTDPACTVLGRAHPTEAVPRECDSPEAKPALKPAVQRPFPGVTRQLPGAAPETLLTCPALPCPQGPLWEGSLPAQCLHPLYTSAPDPSRLLPGPAHPGGGVFTSSQKVPEAWLAALPTLSPTLTSLHHRQAQTSR